MGLVYARSRTCSFGRLATTCFCCFCWPCSGRLGKASRHASSSVLAAVYCTECSCRGWVDSGGAVQSGGLRKTGADESDHASAVEWSWHGFRDFQCVLLPCSAGQAQAQRNVAGAVTALRPQAPPFSVRWMMVHTAWMAGWCRSQTS